MDVTIIYTFIARITSALHIPPYQEIQTDAASVSWAVVSGGPLIKTSYTTFDITVITPNIELLKEQKNVTLGGSYTTSDILAFTGDILYYRLSVTSNGASPAYAIVLQDILSNRLTFGAIVSGPTVGTITLPAPPPAATLIWNIAQLNNGAATATLEFSVTINSMPEVGESISDSASAVYDSNDVNPVQYSAISNQVNAKGYNGMVVDKENGSPVCNAKVELFLNGVSVAIAYTDTAGKYMFSNIAPGEYSIQITKCCYLPICSCNILKVTEDLNSIYNFSLAPDCICSIKCNITEAENELIGEKQRVYTKITDYLQTLSFAPSDSWQYTQILCLLNSGTGALDCCIAKVLDNLKMCTESK